MAIRLSGAKKNSPATEEGHRRISDNRKEQNKPQQDKSNKLYKNALEGQLGGEKTKGWEKAVGYTRGKQPPSPPRRQKMGIEIKRRVREGVVKKVGKEDKRPPFQPHVQPWKRRGSVG